MIYFVHCALSLIILFDICACCDTRYFKNVCLILFVDVKALLGLCYLLYNLRRKIKFLCRRRGNVSAEGMIIHFFLGGGVCLIFRGSVARDKHESNPLLGNVGHSWWCLHPK